MWKVFSQAVVLLAVLCLAACGGTGADTVPDSPEKAEPIEITLWTYPVGEWGNPTPVSGLISSFQKEYPQIHISVEYLDYDTGDARIEEALANGTAPDLVLESPERLVAGWGDRGLLADVSRLWEEGGAEIYDSVRAACRHSSGAYYVFPICMSVHCMAINYDLFQAADALQYLDEETHTWTTDGFIRAVNALEAYGQERVGAVYCGGQGGDQGTRALVNNLYGGSFTDRAHTKYVVDSEENIRALQLLYDLDGIVFDPELTGSTEIDQFCKGNLAMTFCWNCSLDVWHTVKNPDLNFTIFPMAFPTNSSQPHLQSGIWGFGVFDNGSAERIEAAETFIHFINSSAETYTRVVQLSNFWPVKDMEDIYVNDLLMTEYSRFIAYMGDYYQITPNWSSARTAWWTMLQKIGAGANIPKAVKEFSETVNGSAGQ